jgi:hypothetical protein
MPGARNKLDRNVAAVGPRLSRLGAWPPAQPIRLPSPQQPEARKE